MIISSDAYHCLLEGRHPAPPECGGILGGKGGVITRVIFDEEDSSSAQGTYAPNVSLLNHQIDRWLDEGIEFYGMFHTHAPWDEGLSNGDRSYIRRIVKAMPQGVGELFFPVVYPGERILSYVARRDGNDISISDEAIELLDRRGEVPHGKA